MCGIGNPSSPNPGCVFGTGYTGTSPVQIDNNSWLSFTADSTAAELFVQVNVCAKNLGMQMQIFEGNGCCNFTPVSNFLETTTSQSIIASGLTPGNTYYIVVDGFAGDVCSYTISATSGVDVVQAVPASANICLGDTTTLQAQVNGSGSYSYTWTSQPNDPSLTNPTSPIVNVAPTTNTLYTVTITGKCGTPSVANAYVTVNPYPTVTATALDTVLCMGESTTLLGSASGGLFSYNYFWTGAPLLDILPPFPLPVAVFSPSAPGNYTLVVEAVDTIGCNGKDSVNIVVNPSPTANISVNNNPICDKDTVILDATDPSVTAYQWNTGATTPIITETPSTTTTYSVVVANSYNCTDTASQTVTVNPLPNVQISGDSALCMGETTNLSATGASSYQWNTGATSSNISVTPSADSLITVVGTDANNCSNSDTILVQVTAQPTASIIGDSVICIGDTVNLTASGGNTYYWMATSNVAGSTNASVTDIPTANPSQYAVVAIIGNCADTAYHSVIVNPLPVVTVTGNSPICFGDTAYINAQGGVQYIWNTGDTISSISDVPLSSTTYNVTVTDANNCSDTGSYNLIVNPLPVIQITGDDSICDGSSGTLTASGGVSYLWSTNESNSQITVTPTTTTTYYVVGYDNNGCANIDSSTVVWLPKPVAQIFGDTLVCYNSEFVLVATGGSDYLWSDGTSNDTLTGIALDTSNYYVIVGLGKCADTAYTTLFAKPLPKINAFNDTTIFLGQSVGIHAVADYPVQWLNDDSLSCSNCYNPIASPAHTTTYCAQTQLNGCVDTACVTVYVDETCGEVFVPSAFSPNNDGNNDCLKAYGNCIKDIVFRVYSRWGEVIFESTNKNECWDGKYKGKDLNTGVYVFTVNAKLFNGEEVFMKGNVSLFR
jgi:gliding motility-associated-like protein